MQKRAKSANGSNIYNLPLATNLMTLKILNRINLDQDHIIPYEDFYISEVNECVDLLRDYMTLKEAGPGNVRHQELNHLSLSFHL